jgi:rRNA-processing protein EBP2
VGGGSNKRQKKNDKFGFGGKKRFSKSGDAMSSGDLSGFSTRKMKEKVGGAAKRPGKARRAGARRQ